MSWGHPDIFRCWLVPALLAAQTTLASSLPELPSDLSGGVPQVLTPARLQQAQVDVAASVTVIDREMIEALGARDIPDLLRLVPGMLVTNESQAGHTFAVNYHGTNNTDIRRMQLLIDGVSMYQPALSRILWSDLPVSLDDIERIEVTRGPNAAAYGSNSFTSIVNIITTHPQDSLDNMLRVSAGNRDTLDTGGRVVGHALDADWRLSFSTREDSGFDADRYGTEVRDDRRTGAMNLRSEFRPNDRDRLELQAGISGSRKELEEDDYGILNGYVVPPVNETEHLQVMGRWQRDISADHALQVQAYSQRTEAHNPFRACLNPTLLSDELAALSAINQDYVGPLFEAVDVWAETQAPPPDELAYNDPASAISLYIDSLPPAARPAAWAAVERGLMFAMAGYTETCGDVDLALRESRVDIEVQDTLRVNDRLRVVSGAGFRRDGGSSASYTGGGVSNEVWRLFAHGEYRMIDALLLNVGAMLEDDQISGTLLSPRAGINWRFREQQSLRLVSSRAYRTQDLYEEYAKTRITFDNLAPPYDDGSGEQTTRDLFLTQTAPGNLEPEEINALELGYFGYFPAARTEVDLRLFRERLSKLISDAINPFDFESDNNSRTELNGIEGQAKYRFAPRSWFWASYAYIDNYSTHNIEKKFTARHSGSLALAHRFASRWNGSAAWYIETDQNKKPNRPEGYAFQRLDLRLARDFALGGSKLQLSGNTQYRYTDEPHIHDDNNYQDRLYGYLGLKLEF